MIETLAERLNNFVTKYECRLDKTTITQFLRYIGVGGGAFAIDFAALYLLTTWIGLHYLISATIAFSLGLITNYLLCIEWVFDHHRMNNRLHEFLIFGVIGLIGLILNNVMLFLLTEGIGIHYLASKAFTAGFILIFNFTFRRLLLFSKIVH